MQETYKDQFTPADFTSALSVYEMIHILNIAEGPDTAGEYIHFVWRNEPEIYTDLVILDIMKVVRYGEHKS